MVVELSQGDLTPGAVHLELSKQASPEGISTNSNSAATATPKHDLLHLCFNSDDYILLLLHLTAPGPSQPPRVTLAPPLVQEVREGLKCLVGGFGVRLRFSSNRFMT